MLLDICAEHLEEAEILWSRRRTAARSPEVDLGGLAALEVRLNAHLEGLALGARESDGPLQAALRSDDADAAFAASAALLTTREPRLRLAVFQALVEARPPARRGIREALCHLPLAADTLGALEIRLERSAGTDATAIEVLSFHRSLSPGAMAPAVETRDRDSRRGAARACGRVEGPTEWIERLVEDGERGIRDAAIQAAARRGLPWALDRLRAMCRNPARVSPESLRLLACLGDHSDIGCLESCARQGGLGEAAVAGLATLGQVGCVDALMELAGDERLVRAAGRAFARITGLDPPAIEGDSGETDIEDTVFEDLRPIPDAEAMRALWRKRAPEFDPRQRWRAGMPLETECWRTAPHHGDLLTRGEEIARLWMRAPDLFPELELEAPAARQRAVAA